MGLPDWFGGSSYGREYVVADPVWSAGLKGIIFGGLAGCIEIIIFFPTEYVKTQLQLNETGGDEQYSGIVDCVRKTVRRNGFFGLYRGLTVVLVGSVPQTAVRFGTFEALRECVIDERGNLSPQMKLLCGLCTGLCEAVLVVTLMETVKVKLINDQRSESPRFKGILHGVGLILKEQGFRGVYQGLTSTIMKQGSNQAIRFFLMETCKDEYREGDPTKPVPLLVVGGFGAIAGAASVFGNQPIDVVKTRMQSLNASRYTSTWDCFVKIWKNEGPTAFYKGTVPRLSRVCLEVATTFMVYDLLTKLYNNFWS